MKFYTTDDLAKEYPFSKSKIVRMVKAGFFNPMNAPLTGKRSSRGQRLPFRPDQCDEAINSLFENTANETQ
ncbi:MAG: hypothetical protein KAS17_03215 [Victivallaceae bacterium]|nr:hypothetical protein [Victivallaceae bacterium]